MGLSIGTGELDPLFRVLPGFSPSMGCILIWRLNWGKTQFYPSSFGFLLYILSIWLFAGCQLEAALRSWDHRQLLEAFCRCSAWVLFQHDTSLIKLANEVFCLREGPVPFKSPFTWLSQAHWNKVFLILMDSKINWFGTLIISAKSHDL